MSESRNPDPPNLTCKGYYTISVASTAIGVLVVFLLNAATPTEFIRFRFGDLFELTGTLFWLSVFKRLLILLGIVGAVSAVGVGAMQLMLRPIVDCLRVLKKGGTPVDLENEKARRRLVNLPGIAIVVNLSLWIVIPLLFFLSAYLTAFVDLKTAVVFAVRAFMVGLISSLIAFFGIESYSRRTLIPLFFPRGRLTKVAGAARISISRRIRMLYRFGTIVPGTILLVTLLTLQWELDPTQISADAFGRGIIIFAAILSAIFFIATGVLNRMVSRSISDPIHEMLGQVETIQRGDYSLRVPVVSNDEIGLLGDAGNRMIRGLAEREKIRSAFGQYVSPQIRDEILSGRIPLEGERREATILFCDLRNFTPFVENHPSEEVITSMRTYFTAMHRAIRRHNGLVLQFVGDEIEAVFGVPLPFEEHADAALRSALDMRRALEALNAERSALSKPAFVHGIGIHSGDVLAGNTGSDEQSAYTLIGNTVNVASRIQGLTKALECDILVSQAAVSRLQKSYPIEAHPPLPVKGYSKPVVVYSVAE